MLNISRKAWNNILIFTMLIMIFLLNGLHHKLNPSDSTPSSASILPAQSFILTIEYPALKIERIGTSWRSVGKPISNINITINTWLNAQAKVITPAPQVSDPLLVASIWLAGEQLAFTYPLYQLEQNYALFNKQQQQWLLLEPSQAKLLFPQLNESQ